MTIKLYNDNVMLKNCQATVLACEERDEKFFVELDQTVIFPEGGGQLSDRGKINGVNVLHASEKEGRLWHECDAPLEVGAKVEVTLDWAVRLDRMQQHCGEHILSFVCWKLFDSNNIGFHMNEDIVTVDLDKALSEEELVQVEQESNAIIWENRPITVLNLESEEAAKLPMRKFNANLQGILRIVAVENADVCTCCGTHPPVTGMVGCLKIMRAERRKQGQRLEILCGARAMADYAKQNRILRDLATDLSSKVDEVPERYAKMKDEMANLNDALKEKTAKLLDIEIQEVLAKAETRADGAKLLPLVLDDSKTGKNILPRVGSLGNTVSVILAVQPERISYFVALGKDTAGDCRVYIKLLNDTFGGRGGGKPDGAQGGADYCEDWQEKFATVLKQLKEA